MKTNSKQDIMIDAIEPYQDESLYSYLGRYMTLMGMSDDSDDFSKFIHGTARIKTPSLYLADNLNHIANIINLPNSERLGSGKSILNQMTTFPFYKFFFDESIVKIYEEELMKDTYNVNAYCRKLLILTNKNQIERQHVIKYCPECLNNRTYLNREHAVIGNYACWEHGISLRYIPVPKTTQKPLRYADYVSVLEIDYSQGKECILQENVPFFVLIAKYVHDLFTGVWNKYSVKDLKTLLYLKLSERDLLRQDSIDVKGIEKIFPAIRPFIFSCLAHDNLINNVISILNKDITGERIQPIIYIYILSLLCPESEEFYRRMQRTELQEYSTSLSMVAASEEGVDNRETDVTKIYKRFGGEFTFISYVEGRRGYAVIRHEKCQDERPRNIYNILHGKGYCPVCKSNSIPKHDINELHEKYRDKLFEYAGPEFVIDEFLEKGYTIIRHTECGHRQKVLIKDFLKQKRCKGCRHNISRL